MNRTLAVRSKTVPHPDGGTLEIVAQLEHLDANQHPHFSVTGTHRNPEIRGGDNGIVSAGMLHREILALAPEFAMAIAPHLSTDTGVPLHAVENGWYWAGGFPEYRRTGHSYEPDVPNPRILAEHLRISMLEAEVIIEEVMAGRMSKDDFKDRLAGMTDRWEQEADMVRAWLDQS